jgi:Na+-transporting NADH:ubiquinone oxidoreductase subunit C
MPVDGIVKTVIVATALCFVCSMVVSFAAVNLKSIQEVNKAIDKQKISCKLQVFIMKVLM